MISRLLLKLKQQASANSIYSICRVIGIALVAGKLFAADGDSAIVVANTGTTHAPDAWLRQNDPFPDGVLAWNSLKQETNIVADAGAAQFMINFTNVSSDCVVIRNVEPTCGCTTAQLPSLPWVIQAGSSGQFSLTVNLLGKARKQVKTVYVTTDHGFKKIILEINILPPALSTQSKADRDRSLKIAQTDRQAVFHSDCAVCHVKPGEGKEGRALYFAICATCHEGSGHIVTMPDLFAIQTPTNVVFWIDWIAHGKSGTLMPAFSTDDGGPLSEMQIARLASYLNTTDYLDSPR